MASVVTSTVGSLPDSGRVIVYKTAELAGIKRKDIARGNVRLVQSGGVMLWQFSDVCVIGFDSEPSLAWYVSYARFSPSRVRPHPQAVVERVGQSVFYFSSGWFEGWF